MKTIEHYQFITALDLKKFLDEFKETDLSAVYLSSNGTDSIIAEWQEDTLTDGSRVNNINFR